MQKFQVVPCNPVEAGGPVMFCMCWNRAVTGCASQGRPPKQLLSLQAQFLPGSSLSVPCAAPCPSPPPSWSPDGSQVGTYSCNSFSWQKFPWQVQNGRWCSCRCEHWETNFSPSGWCSEGWWIWLENVLLQEKLLHQRSRDMQGELCIANVRELLPRHVVPRKQPHVWGQRLYVSWSHVCLVQMDGVGMFRSLSSTTGHYQGNV